METYCDLFEYLQEYSCVWNGIKINSSGAIESGWKKLGSETYYLGGTNDGAMRSGWVTLSGSRYYFGEADDGALRTGWFKIDETWYYASSGGKGKTGWLKSGSYWYYLNSSGAMLTGIHCIGGKSYVFDNSGAMLAGCEYTIGGKTYNIDENGVIQGYNKVPNKISGFPLIYQNPELPTGCEITALTMVLRYYGFSVSKTTMASTYLPKTGYSVYTGTDGRKYGPDLDEYFVGDPFGSGTICGPGALVTAANEYLQTQGSSLVAKDITGAAFDELYMRVSQNQPVVIMSTIGMNNRRTATDGWYTASGKYVNWSTNDHGSVLIGWNETTVTIACPIYGIKTYSRAQFEKVFASRGYRAMVLE